MIKTILLAMGIGWLITLLLMVVSAVIINKD